MLRQCGFRVWSRACYHRQYRYVDTALAGDPRLAAKCQCYRQEINATLPKDKQLDSSINMPTSVPTYEKHVLVISPQDRSQEDPEWKSAWQSKLELNTKWPYSLISKLKGHLKHSKSGSSVLVNAVAMVSGDVKPLKANEEQIAYIFVLPENRLYAIHEHQIEDFAHFVGGGRLEKSQGHKLSFDDYLKGANNASIRTKASSRAETKSSEPKFQFETSRKDWVLICGHFQRDERCGLIGQDLVREIEKMSLCPNKNVGLISHVGGHKYAGNVIIYNNYLSEDETGKRHLDCLWFGKVLPPSLPTLFQHLREGKIPRELYRGGITMHPAD